MIKVFLFFFYVPYEQRYCDAKYDLEIFTLRNVLVIIVSSHVQLQFPSREALTIKLKPSQFPQYVCMTLSELENERTSEIAHCSTLRVRLAVDVVEFRGKFDSS